MLLMLAVSACTQEVNSPIEKDGTPPAPISNPVIENISGGARISYNLPLDEDLLYVLALVNRNGTIEDFKASYYTSGITLEGFGDTNEYTVDLYAVDRSNNRSTPVSVTIKPLTPPVILVAETLEIQPDFGGISLVVNNASRSDLSIMVFTTDETDRMVSAGTFYTALEKAKFAVRGYDDQLRRFGILIRDKWENFSDTTFVEVVPIYEELLDKSLFRGMLLPTDSEATAWDGRLEYMWDGIAGGDDRAAHTGNASSSGPKHITFDMGVLAKLSRFNLKTIASDKHMYNDVSPRLYEVWGCGDTPDPSGSFDGWTKLVTIENIKPSGLASGQLNEDDRIAGRNGDDADIPSDMPRVRYIRIRCLNNWSGNTNMVINEVTLWGSTK